MKKHGVPLVVPALIIVTFVVGAVVDAAAQSIGTFRWQLAPFCNVLTVHVTRRDAIYTLDGFDDQCGAGQKASLVGTAFLNPDGSVGLGLTTVIAPGGAPVHIDARIGLGSLGGPWRDSAGNIGTFVFTSGGSSGGALRPVTANGLPPNSVTSTQVAPGAIGMGQADLSQLQARVTGVCASGHSIRGINLDGTVLCEPHATAADQAGVLIRSIFEFVTVPPYGQAAVQLASATFTAPVSGTALLKGRGYCNMGPVAGSNNQISIAGGTSVSSAFLGGAISGWGVLNVPSGSVSGLYQYAWTSESRLVNVVAGNVYTAGLFARHDAGNTTNTDCSGSFTVQLFSGSL